MVEGLAEVLGPQRASRLVETRQGDARTAVEDVRGENDDRNGLANDSSDGPHLRLGIRLAGRKHLRPCLCRTGAQERSCCDGERGFHPLPGSKDGLVRVRLEV